MARKIRIAVADTGPLLHLQETSSLEAFAVFSEVIIPEEAHNELKNCGFTFSKLKNLKTVRLQPESKDYAKAFQERYGLGLGEAESISLARQEKIRLILTDDLDARVVAKALNFEVHGTLGIVTRAYSLKIISKRRAREIVANLYSNSSMFLTRDLVEWVLGKL